MICRGPTQVLATRCVTEKQSRVPGTLLCSADSLTLQDLILILEKRMNLFPHRLIRFRMMVFSYIFVILNRRFGKHVAIINQMFLSGAYI